MFKTNLHRQMFSQWQAEMFSQIGFWVLDHLSIAVFMLPEVAYMC